MSQREGRGRPLLALLGLVLIVGGGILLWQALTADSDNGGAVARDMQGNAVRLDPGEDLTQAQRRRQGAKSSGQGRFIVQSVGLNVPLGVVNTVDNQIVPPSFTSAYVIANEGTSLADAARGTVYVAMHSLRNGAIGPGNYLYDVNTAKPKLREGARIRVGNRVFAADGWVSIPKNQLPSREDIWNDVPGRLVIFTCLQLPDNSPSAQNFIITAKLVS
jgi:hypothetical protein